MYLQRGPPPQSFVEKGGKLSKDPINCLKRKRNPQFLRGESKVENLT